MLGEQLKRVVVANTQYIVRYMIDHHLSNDESWVTRQFVMEDSSLGSLFYWRYEHIETPP